MKTKLTKIHYFKWTGDPIAADNELKNAKGIKTDYRGTKLILKNGVKSVDIPRGYNVVCVFSPYNNAWNYLRMSDAQLNDYQKQANKGGHVVLA